MLPAHPMHRIGVCFVVQLLEPAKKADGAVINPLASWRTSFTASDSHNDREANVAGDDAGFIANCRKRSVEPAHRVLDILSSLSGGSSDEGRCGERITKRGSDRRLLVGRNLFLFGSTAHACRRANLAGTCLVRRRQAGHLERSMIFREGEKRHSSSFRVVESRRVPCLATRIAPLEHSCSGLGRSLSVWFLVFCDVCLPQSSCRNRVRGGCRHRYPLRCFLPRESSCRGYQGSGFHPCGLPWAGID